MATPEDRLANVEGELYRVAQLVNQLGPVVTSLTDATVPQLVGRVKDIEDTANNKLVPKVDASESAVDKLTQQYNDNVNQLSDMVAKLNQESEERQKAINQAINDMQINLNNMEITIVGQTTNDLANWKEARVTLESRFSLIEALSLIHI